MFAKTKKLLAVILTISMLMTMVAAGIPAYAVETGETLLYLDFSDPSQVVADSYSAFYSNRDVFTKHGGGSATIDLSVADGKMVIANKVDWARPVIRFGASFEMDTLYRIFYTIAKSDTSKSLSVGHLVELTGELDGSYPSAPGVQTSSVVVNGDSAVITMDFYFSNENGAITYHSGDYTTALPENASLAAMDYAIMLGGEGMDCTVDDFSLTKVGTVAKPEEVDPDALLHLTFNEASQVVAENYSEFYSNRDVFTKHGNGSDATMDLYVENGKMVVANKTGWARPVIRFNHGFETGKTYRIEYVIEKADTTKTLSVEHLFQLTGYDGSGWPTAPDVLTVATVIDGDSATISVEFRFEETDSGLVLTVGDKSTTLPAGCSVAALDYAIVMGGTSTGVYVDSFKLFEVAAEDPDEDEIDPDAMLHLNFSDASQVVADSYSAFYSNPNVFTKHGDGSSATIDMYVENGKLVIANKVDWARPVIRLNAAFEMDTIYRIEYTIAKTDTSKSLSVGHLIQITGSLDGNWPTAPDVMTESTVVEGDSATVSLEFYFTSENGVVTFHCGDMTASLPQFATIAAFDYAIMLGGECTDCTVDNFKLKKVGVVEPEYEPDSNAILYLDFSDAAQAVVDSYGGFYNNRDVFTKHGNGGDGKIDMAVENGKLVITNKVGWGRPVIRFSHDFEMDTIYRIEYTIAKTDTSKSLSVGHLIQITGSLDGNWPTAPDVMTGSTVVEGDSATVSLEFYFTSENGVVTFHCGDMTASLPQFATIAAFDYAIMLDGECTDCTIDNFSLIKVGSTDEEPGGDEDEDLVPEVTGIVANSFHYSSEASNTVDGHMAGAGIWAFNGADGTTTLTVADSMLQITDRTGNRSVAVRLGGGDKFPSNNTYKMALRAKNLEAGKNQTLGYYIQFIGYKDGSYPVIDFSTDSVTLTDEYFLTIATEFEIREEDGVITIVTATGKKSFDAGVTLAAIDVYLVTGGNDSKASIGIDNFYADYYTGEINLDFEDDKHINNVNSSHHSVPYVMTPNAYGANSYNLEFVEGVGLDGSRVMHAIGSTGNWRPQIRLSQGTAKIKPSVPYEISFQIKGCDPDATTKLQIAYDIYYTMPGAPSNFINIQLMSSLVVVNGDWQTVTCNLIIVEKDGGYVVTDGTAYRTLPEGASIAAVDCGFLPITTTDDQTDYYVDNFMLIKLLENPIKMDGVADDADKIIKNGGMEDPMNIGFGRAWAPAENADITLELVSYEAFAGQYSLRISDRKQTWHRAQQRLDDLSVFTEGKKFRLSGAIMSDEDSVFSLSIYVTLGFRDEENPSDINYVPMEIPLSTEHVTAYIWNDMAGEFGIYRNADGNLVITNGDVNDPISLEIPAESVGIAAIDVWFTTAAGCEENPLTAYYIDNMEMIQSGTYEEGGALECTFESVAKADEEEEDTEILLYEDKETGIQIYGDPAVIPVGAQFVVEMSVADAKTEKVLDTYGIFGTTFYTVKLMKDGKEIQPMGKLTVVLPGKSASEQHKLLLVDGKNVIEPNAALNDGHYTVATDILGVFVLAVPSGSNVETGDNTFVIGAGVALVLSLLALLSLVVLKDKFKGVRSA